MSWTRFDETLEHRIRKNFWHGDVAKSKRLARFNGGAALESAWEQIQQTPKSDISSGPHMGLATAFPASNSVVNRMQCSLTTQDSPSSQDTEVIFRESEAEELQLEQAYVHEASLRSKVERGTAGIAGNPTRSEVLTGSFVSVVVLQYSKGNDWFRKDQI